jgi:hypothetical protein
MKKRWEDPSQDRAMFWPQLTGLNRNTRTTLRRVDPTSTAAFGQVASFLLTDAGNFMEQITLEMQLSPITQTGGTVVSYRNDISGIIDTIRFYQAGSLLQQTIYDYLPFHNLCLLTYEQYVAKTAAEGILPLSTRQSAAAAGSQYFYVEIPSPFDYYSIPLSLLTSPVRCEIQFKPMLNCIQFDGSNPQASIQQAILRCRYVQASPQMMAEMAAVSTTTGLLFPFMDLVSTQADFASLTSNIRMLVSEFKSLSAYIGWWPRDEAQIVNTTGNVNYEWTNTISFTSWNLQDNSINTISNPDFVSPNYSRLVEIPWIFHCYFNVTNIATSFPILYSYTLEPERDLHLSQIFNSGYYDFSLTQSAYLAIVGTAATTGQTRITAYSIFYNAYVLRNGALLKTVV